MFVSHNISPVFGFLISCNGYLPINLSCSGSITWFPSFIAYTSSPSSVPQSISLTIISCETSTNLLVKYPESAVLKAVSARPFLAPCEDMKYSNASNPSRKHDLIGISTALPDINDLHRGYTHTIYQVIPYDITQDDEEHILKLMPHCKRTRWHDLAIDIINQTGGKQNGIQKVLDFQFS